MDDLRTDKTRLQALHRFNFDDIFRHVMHAAPFTTRTGVLGRGSSDMAISAGCGMVLIDVGVEAVRVFRLMFEKLRGCCLLAG